MRSRYINSYIVVLLAVVCSGCQEDISSLPRLKERVEVVMNGLVKATTKAFVEPNPDGSPQKQLVIGIITSDYYLLDNDLVFEPEMLKKEDWGMYTYLDRGRFGEERTRENEEGGGTIHYTVPGNIKYTNEDGSSIQNVFYDETGMYYTLRLIYPYEYDYARGKDDTIKVNPTLILSANGSQVVFDIDGSQDIMSSEVGWGNMDSPGGRVVTNNTPIPAGTSETDSIAIEKTKAFNFNHHLVKLDVRVTVDGDKARDLYGKICSIELINQPNQVMLDIARDSLSASSDLVSRYGLVDFPVDSITLPLTKDSLLPCGYVMALPDTKYTFRIATEKRLNFYVDAVFSGDGAQMGYAYPITFAFLSTDEVKIFAEDPARWWYDATFD